MYLFKYFTRTDKSKKYISSNLTTHVMKDVNFKSKILCSTKTPSGQTFFRSQIDFSFIGIDQDNFGPTGVDILTFSGSEKRLSGFTT